MALPLLIVTTLRLRRGGLGPDRFTPERSPAEVIGPMAGFVSLAFAAAWFLVAIMRRLNPH